MRIPNVLKPIKCNTSLFSLLLAISLMLASCSEEEQNPSGSSSSGGSGSGGSSIDNPAQCEERSNSRGVEQNPSSTTYSNPIMVTSAANEGEGSLRAAITSSKSGDVVLIDGSLNNKTINLQSEIMIPEGITIDGRQAPDLVISGRGKNRIFRLKEDKTTTLHYLNLEKGKGDRGGAILLQQKSLLILNNCRLSNSAGKQGGAIYMDYRSSLQLDHCELKDNNSLRGDLIRSGGGIASNSGGSLTVKNSLFSGNKGVNGGAINLVHTVLEVVNCGFVNNTSSAQGSNKHTHGNGGAIFTDGVSEKVNGKAKGGTLKITDSDFKDNTGQGQGGGAFLFVYPPDKVILEACVFDNNVVKLSPDKDESYGGGLRHGNGELTMTNCAVINNRAFIKGGGIYIDEKSPVSIKNCVVGNNKVLGEGGKDGQAGGIGMYNKGYKTTLTNTTVAHNYAGFQGAGIASSNANKITLKGCIFAYNEAGNNDKGWDVKHHTMDELKSGGNNYQYPGNEKSTKSDPNITSGATIKDPQLEELKTDNTCIPFYPVPDDSPAKGAGTEF